MLEFLHQALELFGPNELAYYALTSKPEIQIRDRVAYCLHQQMLTTDPCAIAAREWHRIDLAVLREGKLSTIVEFKSLYSFDLCQPRNLREYSYLVAADMVKRAEHIQIETEYFSIVTITHPRGMVQDCHQRIVKYHQGINRAVLRFGTHDAVLKQALNEWGAVMAMHKLPHKIFVHHAGSAFGLDVDIAFVVIQKPADFDGQAMMRPSSTTPLPPRGEM